jgi:hypothetical protein
MFDDLIPAIEDTQKIEETISQEQQIAEGIAELFIKKLDFEHVGIEDTTIIFESKDKTIRIKILIEDI